ncbi:MAG: aspartate-semialdehyde dehydrogenase [Planctomycetota bacterium]|nr:MAG: aspartate-semialdehyde dehydrogenase [Planctomycetota bacterium]
MGRNVAIVGATGAVGVELLRVLEAREFPLDALRLLASPRSAGRRLRFRGEELPVELLGPRSFDGCSLAFFSAGAGVSRAWAPRAVEAGAVVVDNSSAFRYEPDVPLVVPEVNAEAVLGHRGIVANPNCTTILLLVVLAPLHARAGVRRCVVATYQAASGAGAQAVRELEDQSRALLAGEEPRPERFPRPLAFNLFPHVDSFLPEEGFATREEMKVVWEARKILGVPDLALVCTCVRVPVFRAHSEAVFLQFERPLSLEEARSALSQAPGVRVVDDPEAAEYPTPRLAEGGDEVLVGRLRVDPSCERGLCLFLAGDQVRKGAALNAVQIAELLA